MSHLYCATSEPQRAAKVDVSTAEALPQKVFVLLRWRAMHIQTEDHQQNFHLIRLIHITNGTHGGFSHCVVWRGPFRQEPQFSPLAWLR